MIRGAVFAYLGFILVDRRSRVFYHRLSMCNTVANFSFLYPLLWGCLVLNCGIYRSSLMIASNASRKTGLLHFLIVLFVNLYPVQIISFSIILFLAAEFCKTGKQEGTYQVGSFIHLRLLCYSRVGNLLLSYYFTLLDFLLCDTIITIFYNFFFSS